MAVLEVRDLRASYSASGPEILKGISFRVEADDFFAIIGPSGAGKSTLIRCINRLVEPSAGEIIFYDREVTKLRGRQLRMLRRDMGMIFQEFNLIDRMSVMDNVLSGRLGYTGNLRSLFRAFPREDIQHALSLLDRVGLLEHVDKRADELSGGQRQRVGIARALMQNPKLLLVDEPETTVGRRTHLGPRPKDFPRGHGADQTDGHGTQGAVSVQYPRCHRDKRLEKPTNV